MSLSRSFGRTAHDMRPVRIDVGVLKFAESSVRIEFGDTHVLCAVTVEERVPGFLRGSGTGWVTAEYGMLPRSTKERSPREAREGRQGGRTQEIQRLIGRSLRAVTKLDQLGERTFTIDCDVLQADGGTRTASITGAWVALALALRSGVQAGLWDELPLHDSVAAVSAGVLHGEVILDLDYPEDSRADVDCNVVMTGAGRFVEIQGTAEREPFDQATLSRLLEVSTAGIRQLSALQAEALER